MAISLKSKNKTTILFVDQALSFGGSVVVLGGLVEAINKNSYRSVVVGEMDESILDYHMQGQAKIHVVRRLFNYAQWEKVTSAAKRIKPQFLFKLVIYFMSAVRSIANVIYIVRLVKIILVEKVDLVHVNNGMSNFEPVIAALLLRRRFIVHFHGVEKPGFIHKLLLNKVDRFIIISDFLYMALVENGFPKNHMTVIPNPVQKSHALSSNEKNVRKQYGLSKKDKIFAIVGRIVRWKGHIEFLNSAFLVLENLPDAKALIVGDFSDGDASYQDEIMEIIKNSGYGDRILMTGYVKDVSRIYSIMDVCVHTSIEPEPFGLVIVEAMINGVPVIASDVGAPAEIIKNKVNGYIVSPFMPTKLAAVITELLINDELRSEIGRRGRMHVQENYDIESYAHSVERVYAEVLGTPE
ncbi:hypothetical protein MNBD_GAMMA06-591 [hydrothermal vent metagenome]|uniref:Glycosyltransferase n=1 Tax=hydrothermal vent metagenome TaxID=652676 RepID=A0A3B0WHH7_9ZZZZ